MKEFIAGTHIASRYVFVQLARVVIQQDIKRIENGSFKIKEPYIAQLERMHTLATNECRELKVEMRDKKIKVITMENKNGFTAYKYIVGQIEQTKPFYNPIIRRNVKEILEDLIQQDLH